MKIFRLPNPGASHGSAMIVLLLFAGAFPPGDAGAQGCARITVPNPAPAQFDGFGYAVAVSGGTALVGAYNKAIGGVGGIGRVYVVDAAGGAILRAIDSPAAPAQTLFGNAVALSGSVAVIGAQNDSSLGAGFLDAGKVYVFDASTGAPVATLLTPHPQQFGFFGKSVGVSGNAVVVGAHGNRPPGIPGGAAYVFDATSGALTASLVNPAASVFDQFGYSVGIDGGIAVVGAPGDAPTGLESSGAAYTFNAATGARLATLGNPTPEAYDQFGIAVAVSGDRVLIGAAGNATEGVVNSGTAYIYDANTGALLAQLDDPDPQPVDRFGDAVSLSGNAALIGASWKLPGGMAYLFDATTRQPLATLANPDPEYQDYFGISIAIDGTNAIVGAYATDFKKELDAGTAYLFNCAPGAASRAAGDFDGSGCTGVEDFLFLLDNWHTISPAGPPEIGINDFLALLDNWHTGAGCA